VRDGFRFFTKFREILPKEVLCVGVPRVKGDNPL